MKVVVNDLAFEFPLYTKAKTMETVERFILICQKLESQCCHNVRRLVRTEIDKEKELYPTGKLYRVIQDITDRDKRKYFLGLLVNRENTQAEVPEPFAYKNVYSYACAGAKEDALVSLETDDGFKLPEIAGSIGREKVVLKNISCEDHIDHYQDMLGIRIFEANAEKHKKDRENAYGKGKVASPMDLPDDEAQELLDRAVWIKGHLYGRRGSHNYVFQNTGSCVYHAYIADDLGDDILTELHRKKWD